MIGEKFGNWLVIAEAPKRNKKLRYLCRCSCEDKTERVLDANNLRSGASLSCGCLRRKMDKKLYTADGQAVDATSPIYRAWSNMKASCENPKYLSYESYGGAGIKYDERWASFQTFCEDMLETYVKGYGLQRKDCTKDFNKENCFWVQKSERKSLLVKDLVGQRFGSLVVQSFAGKTKANKAIWTCLCDCGQTKDVVGGSLVNGLTTSCGCYHKKVVTSHGLHASPIYQTWADMKQRCDNPENDSYLDYGGRGITYPNTWATFEGFLEAMGSSYADGMTIERIDPNLGYSKENCRWATKTEQTRNKRNTRMVTWKGEEMPLVKACERENLHYHTVIHRLATYGWTEERALSTPTSKPYYSRSKYEE